MMCSLTNWYLQGTTLHPTAEHLRTHVTKLSENETSTTLTLTFTDEKTITLSHAHLSISPLHNLKPFTTLKLDATSDSFCKIRDFVYCTPVDLSDTPVSFVKAAKTWELDELYNACFLVAESAGFDIVRLVERFIPLVTYEHTPKRFKSYLAARMALDAPVLVAWLKEDCGREEMSNKGRLLDMLEKGDMTSVVRKALREHSEIAESEIIGYETDASYVVHNLFWEIPLGELLGSEKEYFEGEISTDGASGYVEMTWNKQGARLIVGLEKVEKCEKIDISCCVMGLRCECGDLKHNLGWCLDGGVKRRSVEWVVIHEVEFLMFDGAGLKEWREIHADCRVRVKIRVVGADGEEEEEEEEEKDEEKEDIVGETDSRE